MFYSQLNWVILLLSIIVQIESARDEDFVESIPGYPKSDNFKTYSGQLELDIDQQSGRIYKSMHYIFVTSTNNPETDPVLVWLNGGPGCSSLQGWIKEIGPFVLNDGDIEVNQEFNKYSWNQKANLLFLESPSGVGFSQIDQSKQPKFGDEITHQENYQALVKFFEYFPEFIKNPFYISGESYAGIYIPHLAKKILDMNKDSKDLVINLKGLIIGNGVTDQTVSLREKAKLDFGWGHQLYSPEIRETIETSCVIDRQSPRCRFAHALIKQLAEDINPYDIYGFCYSWPEDQYKDLYPYTPWFEYNYNKQESTQSNKKKSSCTDHRGMEIVLNKNEVKQALHVNTKIQWLTCSSTVSTEYAKDPQGSLYVYPELIKAGLEILFFSGDTDLVVPFTEAPLWIPKLNLKIIKEQTSWRVDDQVAGFVTKYENKFTFLTVKGAGHMVPTWKRKEAYAMISRYFEGGNY